MAKSIDLIKHEEEMIHRRIGWFLAFQGFLFFSFSKLVNVTPNEGFTPFSKIFILSIIILGLCNSIFTAIGVRVAYYSIGKIREVSEKEKEEKRKNKLDLVEKLSQMKNSEGNTPQESIMEHIINSFTKDTPANIDIQIKGSGEKQEYDIKLSHTEDRVGKSIGLNSKWKCLGRLPSFGMPVISSIIWIVIAAYTIDIVIVLNDYWMID